MFGFTKFQSIVLVVLVVIVYTSYKVYSSTVPVDEQLFGKKD